MKRFLSNVIKFSLLIALTGFLLYQSYYSIPEDQLKEGQTRFGFILETLSGANFFYLFLTGLTAMLSHVIRAERWRILLRPIGYTPSLYASFHAVMNGYFVNLAVPRGGEISRPISLKRMEGVPVEQGLGTVVTERVIDMLFLLICIGSVFVFQLTKFSEFFTEILKAPEASQHAEPDNTKLYIVGGLLFAGLIFFASLYIIKKIKPEVFDTVINKIKTLLVGLKEGLTSIFKLQQRALFIFYSIMIWVMYYLMLVFFMIAIPGMSHLGLMDALTIFVVGGIAMALPLPGGTGTYHFLVPKAFVLLCGLENQALAVAFATLNHAYVTVVFILFGAWGMYVINKKSKEAKLNGH